MMCVIFISNVLTDLCLSSSSNQSHGCFILLVYPHLGAALALVVQSTGCDGDKLVVKVMVVLEMVVTIT